MDIRTISSNNYIPIIDPAFIRQTPDEFLAENGGFLNEVAVVSKSTSGFVNYRSTTAPTDTETGEFFSTFTTIADSIGIKVYAIINGFADSFQAKNFSFSAIKDGGNPSQFFVDPFKFPYTTYLKSIINEVNNFPVQGFILDNIRFPREDYSFCENCCRTFSERSGIERLFSLTDLQKDNRLQENWLNFRADRIETILRELLQSSFRKNMIINATIDIDPTLNGEKGALNHFGQKIELIGKYCTPMIHLSAWTPLPSAVDTPEYQALIKHLKFVKTYQAKSKTNLNLYIWGAENESVLTIIEALKREMLFNKIFIQNHFPKDYQIRREIHLGLA